MKKKLAKRFLAMLMTLVMLLGMAVPAMADDETDNHDYKLYQIFTSTYYKDNTTDPAKEILSDVKWGENAKIPDGEVIGDPVPEGVLKELENVKDSNSDSEKLAVIEKYVNLNSTAFTVASANITKNSDGSVTYTNLAPGYYLIKDAKAINGNDVYTTYVVRVTDGTLTFKRKGDVPTVDKKILDTTVGEDKQATTEKVEANEASIGDTINFEITGTLPSNFDDYKEYTYFFTDTLSKGLTYTVNSVKVNVVNEGMDDVEVTKYFYVDAKTETNGEATLKVAISDLKALQNVPSVTLNAQSKIVVTYSATLNEDAVIAREGNKNSVTLAYSNDPNNSGKGTITPPPENPKDEPKKPTGETPEKETVTYTTELTILKTNENGNVLTGAEFTLTGEGVNVVLVAKETTFKEDVTGEYWKLKNDTYTTEAPNTSGGEADNSALYESTTIKYTKTISFEAKGTGKENTTVAGTVDASGRVTFRGLGAGTYTISETVTPAGYNTIDDIVFTLTFDASGKKFESTNKSIIVGADNMLDTTIVNQSGSLLPETGGMGTTIFYVVGSILLIGAAVLLITKKRMSAEQ